jgi:hypothetical protein
LCGIGRPEEENRRASYHALQLQPFEVHQRPYLQLSGVGQADLGAETLALALRPMARVAGAAVSVPVVVEGPFRAVQSRLDASGLDKLGLLIDAWFGGDPPPQICSQAGLAPPAQERTEGAR